MAELPAEVRAQLEALRVSLIRDINRHFDKFYRISGQSAPQTGTTSRVMSNPGEVTTMALSDDTSVLRGTKPLAIRYGDVTIPANSWKKAFAAILDICNQQEEYHQALLKMREVVAGRGRKFVSASPEGMYSALRIDNDLYVETNFSTEALLKFLKDRILAGIGFDASSITLEYRSL